MAEKENLTEVREEVKVEVADFEVEPPPKDMQLMFGLASTIRVLVHSPEEFEAIDGQRAFVMRKYPSRSAALEVYDLLLKKPHPCVAPLGRLMWFDNHLHLAFEKQGVSLRAFVTTPDHGKELYDSVRVTESYQKILRDLILVVKHFTTTRIRCQLDMDSIFILYGGVAHIHLTRFELRGEESVKSDWENLAKVIEDMNEKAKYVSGREMIELISTIRKGSIQFLKTIFRNSIFWTPEERRLFIYCLSDILHRVYGLPIYNSETASAFEDWETKVSEDSRLRLLEARAKARAEAARAKMKGIPEEVEVSADLTESPSDDQIMRGHITFIRGSLGHFLENKSHIQNLDIESVDQLQRIFEAKFPGYVFLLSGRALVFENISRISILPPYRTLESLENTEPYTVDFS